MRYNSAILTFILLALFVTGYAQSPVLSSTTDHEGQERASKTTQLDIPRKDAKELFEEFMSDTYDVSVDGLGFLQNRNTLSATGVLIPALGEGKVDLYARFSGEDITKIALLGRDGYNAYFNGAYRPESFEQLSKLLNAYQRYASNNYYEDVLEDMSSEEKKMRRMLRKTNKSISKNEDQISDNIEENEELREEIKNYRQVRKEQRRDLRELQSNMEKTRGKLK